MRKTELKPLSGISSNTLAKLGRDEFVSMDALARICGGLDVNIEDVMEFVND